ncbi:MAG TPA: hypothetical protein VGM37_21795 [Armatimonadota bacterium]|jgi:hypothetical protein
MRRSRFVTLPLLLLSAHAPAAVWDTRPDTWAATDGLGRALPGYREAGPAKPGKQVAAFYFLWLGQHGRGGPYDVSRILKQDPEAMTKPDSPLWGPMYAPHHWGESLFGYYLSDDRYVIRKHAQMLSDAGVDAIVFDVTNGFTYEKNYKALCEVFEQVRRDGGRTPQIAFLTPFWNPTAVVRELYRDLYGPGLHKDLWYRQAGKPLILADPALMRYEQRIGGADAPETLLPGHTLGQTFSTDTPIIGAGMTVPTYTRKGSGAALTLRKDGPDGAAIASRRFANIADNSAVVLPLPAPQPPGRYYLEMSDPVGEVGWYGRADDAYADGDAFADGRPAPGDRGLWLDHPDNPDRAILNAFTFRKPVASYFTGPDGPDEWGWLEATPQHAFRNSAGKVEEVTVGIAQNAVEGQLGVLSNPASYGRSFHNGAEPPPSGRDFTGRNVQEQWKRALALDPRVVFFTGWNEWIAGRFPASAPFHGAGPVSFVDEFNAEFSRDAEPMKGGHGDAYYMQLVAYVRRFKGVHAPPPSGPEARIAVDGRFADWAAVRPEYRDDVGDTAWRDHEAWNPAMPRYTNRTGRNDFELLKVARDSKALSFYARTRRAISGKPDALWMRLFLDTDESAKTGWLGYDWTIRPGLGGTAELLRWAKGRWRTVANVPCRVAGAEMELSIPRAALGLKAGPIRLGFQWQDNVDAGADVLNLYRNGDAAPNGRFQYRYAADAPKRRR